jgi:hypothetical protein
MNPMTSTDHPDANTNSIDKTAPTHVKILSPDAADFPVTITHQQQAGFSETHEAETGLLEHSATGSRNQSSMHHLHDINALAVRRKFHLRQLRTLFIYPIVYLLMWMIPFVSHCMQYWNKWATRGPPFPVVLLSTICLTSMGAVDCIIFSVREQPWRHTKRLFREGGVDRSMRTGNERHLSEEKIRGNSAGIWDDLPGKENEFVSYKRQSKTAHTSSDLEKSYGSTDQSSPSRRVSVGIPAPSCSSAREDSPSDQHHTHKPLSRQISRPIKGALSVRPGLMRGQSDYCVVAAEQAYRRLAEERRDRRARSVDGTDSENVGRETGNVGGKEWWSGLASESTSSEQTSATSMVEV